MRIDITDLPLNLQKQALRKLAEIEARQGQSRAKSGGGEAKCGIALQGQSGAKQCGAKHSNKYHAKKVTLTLNDGTEHTFDSKHEAEVYQDLSLRERAGEISNLQLQVPYELIPKQKAPSGKTYRNCRYIADFAFNDSEGKPQVWDAKGFRTKEYQIKKKLMLHQWGIEIQEV